VGHAAIGTQSERRPWMALALVVTAQFMVILDASPLRRSGCCLHVDENAEPAAEDADRQATGSAMPTASFDLRSFCVVARRVRGRCRRGRKRLEIVTPRRVSNRF
jgi:hypothetical protein